MPLLIHLSELQDKLKKTRVAIDLTWYEPATKNYFIVGMSFSFACFVGESLKYAHRASWTRGGWPGLHQIGH